MKTFLLLLVAIPIRVQSQTVSLDSLHREFERFLTGPTRFEMKFDPQDSAKYSGKHLFTVEFKFEPADGSLLAEFAKDNRQLLDYIAFNHAALKDEYLFWHTSDSARFAKTVSDSQWRNLYFERLTQIMGRSLEAKKHINVEGLKFNERPKLTFAQLQAYAAKFFYPDSIWPNGGIQTHICEGFNGFRDMSPPRNLLLEAVAYSVVSEHILIENDPISSDLDSAINMCYRLKLSDDRNIMLLRTQGVVWGIMSQSPSLEKAIRDMYALKKEWLTFELN